MIVRPDATSASKAPSTRPLKHCDMKLAQLIIGRAGPDKTAMPRRRRLRSPAARRVTSGSGIVAEVAAEGVRFLHQRRARHDLEDLPVVLLVLHVLGCLALDDDHRTDELVVFLAEIDLADGRVELLALLVLLDDVRRIERVR